MSQDTYWKAECCRCNWTGWTNECGGGNAIADTGDYSDPTCPMCGTDVFEVDEVRPRPIAPRAFARCPELGGLIPAGLAKRRKQVLNRKPGPCNRAYTKRQKLKARGTYESGHNREIYRAKLQQRLRRSCPDIHIYA